MGAGIAQLGCQAGLRTLLYDPIPEALAGAEQNVRRRLAKFEGEPAPLNTVDSLALLATCDLVVEAVPERAELKRELFRELSGLNPRVVLATNTSSILVTSLASAAARPENVVGMHFFNPPPVMRLVEVIAAEQTSERVLELATDVAERMGKRVIRAQDGPGFLVNRCNRPFGAEALRLLQERVATHEQIDRIVRLGGGFRMGPFELMDLVGIDVGFEVAKSFMEQSFGEPRWKPSPLQARMVAAGRLGRKSGGGWYDYPPGRPDDPEPLEPGGGVGRRISFVGSGRLWDELRERAREAGFEDGGGLVIGDGDDADVVLRAGRELGGRVGFHLLPPLGRLVELTGERDEEVERVFAALGFHCEWVGDAPGLVLGRIASQLVNEAAFAIGEGVGSPEDVDAGMTLGLNHPRGPVEWWRAIGTDHVVSILDALREERYRVAPLLRRGSIPSPGRGP
jgi:3-hydroxybutyryl-CoA dehydrogenase